MFSVITNIYNKKTKGPTLMELFTATGKMKKIFLTTRYVRFLRRGWHGTHRYNIQVHTHASTLFMCVCELEYRIDVCSVTRVAHIEYLWLSKTLFYFSCGCEQFH